VVFAQFCAVVEGIREMKQRLKTITLVVMVTYIAFEPKSTYKIRYQLSRFRDGTRVEYLRRGAYDEELFWSGAEAFHEINKKASLSTVATQVPRLEFP